MPADGARLGFLYPCTSGEDDYPAFLRLLPPGVSIQVVTTRCWDTHTPADIARTGAVEVLLEGVPKLRAPAPDAVMWACTCASFVHGLAAARAQARALEEAVGAPTGSTSLAFLEAAGALGLRRVALAATYPENVAALFVAFLREGGVEVVARRSLGLLTGGEVGALAPDEVVSFVERADVPTAEAVLVPDTAMRSCGTIAALERRLGKPVLTANQVTIWQGLRLAGCAAAGTHHPELGALFRATRQEWEVSA